MTHNEALMAAAVLRETAGRGGVEDALRIAMQLGAKALEEAAAQRVGIDLQPIAPAPE